MPRNGSSVYSLPAGNPVVAGTVIATTWANTTLTDIATALTNSLSTDGSTASVSLAGKTMSGGTFSGPTVTSVLTLTGGQIAFPAVQVPSAGANTLDDYEEGTWTPTVTAATPGNLNVIYSNRVGSYVKIGKLVCLRGYITTSTWTFTTASGNIQVTGLPFASSATGDTAGSVSRMQTNQGAGNNVSVACEIASAASLLTFAACNTANGSTFTLVIASTGTGTNPVFTFEINYEAA